MKLTLLSALAAFSLALPAISGSAHPGHSHALPKPPRTANHTLGATDAGHTISVRVGDEFTVKLASNASTGFAWVVAKNDAKMLSVRGGDYIGPVGKPPGAPGVQVWRFKALRSGQAKIELDYLRRWEKVAPAHTWTVTVKVK